VSFIFDFGNHTEFVSLSLTADRNSGDFSLIE